MQNAFLTITITCLLLFIIVTYNKEKITRDPISNKILIKLKEKELYIKNLIYQKYKIRVNIPIEISSKIRNDLFGLTLYEDKENIKIILNKKRFYESSQYMINSVLAHEYAHALMFIFGDYTDENSGHSKKWQNICFSLESNDCQRFVNNNDVIMNKLKFIK